MGTILKIGKGTLETRISLNGKNYGNADGFDFNNYRIEVQKTDNFPVNNNTFRDHWRFNYFDKENNLKMYFAGEPERERIFHLHKIQNTKFKEMPNILKIFHFGYHSLRAKINKSHKNIYRETNGGKGILLTWAFLKKYLKKEGFEKIVTKTDYRFYDTLTMGFKMGWIDKDRERKLEQFYENIPERNKNLKRIEKATGLVELEYLL